jgi:hypothetical protein
MPQFEIHRLRTSDGLEDEYRVVETVPLPALGAGTALSVVGTSVSRVEGREKATGRAGVRR